MDKRMKQLVRTARKQGATVIETRNGFRILGPKGTSMIHKTPCAGQRTYLNCRAELRRAGIKVPS